MSKDYKGVHWNRRMQRWVSSIKCNGVAYNCGSHLEQLDAVKARDMCIINHGLGIEKLQIIKPICIPLLIFQK